MRIPRFWIGALAALAALGSARVPARAGPPTADDGGPPAPPPPFTVETVTVPTADGAILAGTYGAAGSKPGSPAVVLVHMEGSTRAAWEPLYTRLQEHRVPWLAIDLRGYGGSAVQGAKDLSADARARSADLQGKMGEDVYGAIRWLVDARGHDPKKIGVMGAGLGASAAMRCAHVHKGDIAGLVLLTPRVDYEGFETVPEWHDVDGKMEVRIIASVEDTKLPNGQVDKKGPLHLLYNLEIDRNAPRDTPYDEREAKRRGVPPRWRGLPETNVRGTKMLTGVLQMDCWLAAWWARTLGTYPNPVLWDGSVDRKNDFADPAWDAGVKVPGPAEFDARALRWGRRVMVGSEFSKDAKTLLFRIQCTRGELGAAQIGTIEVPANNLTVSRVQLRGRWEPISLDRLLLPPPEIPIGKGQVEYGNPSYELEYRLPEITGSAPFVVRLALSVVMNSGVEIQGTGVDPAKPETWVIVPDSDGDAPAGRPSPDAPPEKPTNLPPRPPGR